MNTQEHEPGHTQTEKTSTEKQSPKRDEFSAQFGAEGLSLKVSLPKWAKAVLAILLAIGMLESLVIVKAIEIHDRYEQSQIAHDRLVKQLTGQIQKAEEEERQAEEETQAAIYVRAAQWHLREDPSGSKWIELPSGRGRIRLSVFSNDDILITKWEPDGTALQSWILAGKK